MYKLLLKLALIFLTACDSSAPSHKDNLSQSIAKGEYIYRRHDDTLFQPPSPQRQPLPVYPWKNIRDGEHRPLTKYHFRCKGYSLNSPKKTEQNGQVRYLTDCNGPLDHSLPLKDGEEFIYPILIDLLNYVQRKTGKSVVITSGHRCPEHHNYVDNTPTQKFSKHMIGAEVNFYVKDLENQPELSIALLQEYFFETAQYQGQNDYLQFTRWNRPENDVVTLPWCNKEIFIKLYQKHEGRNFDNSHSYPYISIQVRYDKDKKEKVIYSWDKAFKGFFRH